MNKSTPHANLTRRAIEEHEFHQERATSITERFKLESTGGNCEALVYSGNGFEILITDGNYADPRFNGPWYVAVVLQGECVSCRIGNALCTCPAEFPARMIQSGDWQGFHEALLAAIVHAGLEDDFS